MALIQWDDSFSVGIDEIDAQHQRWIQIINDMDDALTSGDAEKLLSIKQQSLSDMIEYTRFHFCFEEQLMAKINYPHIETHKNAHIQFTERLLNIQADIRSGFQPLNTQLMSIMMNWLKDHILSEDKQYTAYADKLRLCIPPMCMGKTFPYTTCSREAKPEQES